MDPQMQQATRGMMDGPSPVQEIDEVLAEQFANEAEGAAADARGHAVECERKTRLARAYNAAVEQLQMADPAQDIDFSPRTTQGQMADAVVAAGGGPRP